MTDFVQPGLGTATTPARLTLSFRLDDICLVVALAAMLGLFLVIGLWCLIICPAYLLGGISHSFYESGGNA
jgi:hypothetical protein